MQQRTPSRNGRGMVDRIPRCARAAAYVYVEEKSLLCKPKRHSSKKMHTCYTVSHLSACCMHWTLGPGRLRP